jgi:hypothetical protein
MASDFMKFHSRCSGFKGWFPGTLINEINGKEKKREAINPEPGTRNL